MRPQASKQPRVQYVDVASRDAGMRLDNYLRRWFKDVPKSRLYGMIRSGEVRINKGRVRPATRLACGDRLRVPPVDTRRGANKGDRRRPPDAMIRRAAAAIMSETPDYLLIAKPPDMPVHAGSGVDFGLIECLRAAWPEQYLELVHRLDRGTSGALLVARSRPARRDLAVALASADARKTYLALVDGAWPAAVTRVDSALDRHAEAGGQARVRVDPVYGKPAVSEFRVVERAGDATLLEVDLETGRKHQIRAHAAHIGHPIAADKRYGDSQHVARWRQLGLKRPFLHAWRLAFPWRGEVQRARVEPPEDLVNLLGRLGLARVEEQP